MKTINNFDSSSTGVNIEFSGCYDNDASTRDFEECFDILKHSGYRESSVLYYTNYGNVSDSGDISFSVKGTKENLLKFILEYSSETKSAWNKLKKEDLISEVENYLSDSLYILSYRDENKEISKYGLEIVPSKELVWVESRGYSKGDYAEIVYCPSDLKEAWGREDIGDMRETFDNLCWDSPVRAEITINGEEYSYWEADLKSYEWEREKFIEYVANESGIEKTLIEEIVPNDLDYQY